MKKLILASLAVAVTLASCEKTSLVDSTLTTNQKITYSTYAGASSTKGTAVNSNSDFCGAEGSYGSFKVAANFQSTSENNSGAFFEFCEVKYSGTSWVNQASMYWPNEAGTIYFGAYYPSSSVTTPSVSYSSGVKFSFDYTVAADVYATNSESTAGQVADHKDIMYALTSKDLVASTDGTEEVIGTESSVNLHFKHALTQIGFTATKDANIEVAVRSIKICNVIDGGTFAATTNTDDTPADKLTSLDGEIETDNFGSWTVGSTLGHYVAAMAYDAGEGDNTFLDYTTVGTTATQLTSTGDVLMLIPQGLTAWVPTATDSTSSTNGVATGTGSYLAIDCVIKHTGSSIEAGIIDGIVYVPFSTTDIPYYGVEDGDNDQWLPGYKITYNLVFGGGYAIPGDSDETTPLEPGEVPDPDDIVSTLRAITYTVTVDEWITNIDGDEDEDADDDDITVNA